MYMIGFKSFEESNLGSRKLILAFQLIGIGWFVVVCIVGGTMLGSWISSFFSFSKSEVFFLVAGLLLGIFTAGVGTYNLVNLLLKSD